MESTGHSVQLPAGDQKLRVETVGGKIAQTYIEGHKSRTKVRVLVGMMATAVPGPVPGACWGMLGEPQLTRVTSVSLEIGNLRPL